MYVFSVSRQDLIEYAERRRLVRMIRSQVVLPVYENRVILMRSARIHRYIVDFPNEASGGVTVDEYAYEERFLANERGLIDLSGSLELDLRRRGVEIQYVQRAGSF